MTDKLAKKHELEDLDDEAASYTPKELKDLEHAQVDPKPLPEGATFDAVLSIPYFEEAYYGFILQLGDSDKKRTYQGLSVGAWYKVWDAKPRVGSKVVDELWRDLMYLGYYSPSRSRTHQAVKSGEFTMDLVGAVLALKHDLVNYFGVSSTMNFEDCRRLHPKPSSPGPVYYPIAGHFLPGPHVVFGEHDLLSEIWKPGEKSASGPIAQTAWRKIMNQLVALKKYTVPAPIPEGKAPAGKDVVVERVDVGEAREDLIPLVISATEDYQNRIQQALSEHQAQVDEAKAEKKPPPKKLTRSEVEKRPEIVARKARLKKLSDQLSAIENLCLDLGAKMERLAGRYEDIESRGKVEVFGVIGRLIHDAEGLAEMAAAMPKKGSVSKVYTPPSCPNGEVDPTVLDAATQKDCARHSGEYDGKRKTMLKQLDQALAQAGAFGAMHARVHDMAADYELVDLLMQPIARRKLRELAAEPPFSIELERALRGEVDSSESGKVIERLENAAGLHRSGHVAYMDRALERLAKALRKLVKEIDQVDVAGLTTAYHMMLRDFSRVDRGTARCIKQMREGKLLGKRAFVLPRFDEMNTRIVGASGKEYNLPVNTEADKRDILTGVIDRLKTVAPDQKKNYFPVVDGDGKRKEDLPVELLLLTLLNESSMSPTFSESQVGEDRVAIYGMDWANIGAGAGWFEPFTTDPRKWISSRGYGLGAITMWDATVADLVWIRPDTGEAKTFNDESTVKEQSVPYMRGLVMIRGDVLYVPIFLAKAEEGLRVAVKTFVDKFNYTWAKRDCTWKVRHACKDCLAERFKVGTNREVDRDDKVADKDFRSDFWFDRKPVKRLLESALKLSDPDELKEFNVYPKKFQSYYMEQGPFQDTTHDLAGYLGSRIEYPCSWLLARSHYAGGGWEALNHMLKLIFYATHAAKKI